MTEHTGQKLLTFFAANAVRSSSMNVTWYGGEPLLSAELVLKLCSYTRATLAGLGCAFRAGIVTNGTLLTPSLATALWESGISSIQLTLDGCREDHDQRRRGTQGQGTFDRILKAVAMLPPNMKVTVRVNVDADNIKGIPDMLEELGESGANCHPLVYFAPIHGCEEGCQEYAQFHRSRLLSAPVLLERVADFLPLACRVGLDVRLPLRQSFLCGAVARQAIVVEPDGTLKKCWNDVGASCGAVGTLDEPLSLDNPNLVSWLTYDPFTLPECRECDVFDLCLGGCPWMVRHNVSVPDRCHAFKGTLRKIQDVVGRLVAQGCAEFDLENGILIGRNCK